MNCKRTSIAAFHLRFQGHVPVSLTAVYITMDECTCPRVSYGCLYHYGRMHMSPCLLRLSISLWTNAHVPVSLTAVYITMDECTCPCVSYGCLYHYGRMHMFLCLLRLSISLWTNAHVPIYDINYPLMCFLC